MFSLCTTESGLYKPASRHCFDICFFSVATGNAILDSTNDSTNDVLPSDDVSYQWIDEVEGKLNH